MIDAGYVKTMARYNAWQNQQLIDGLADVGDADLRADRGAFFGSIFATLNHLLWGDTIWMSRFTPEVAAPAVPPAAHKELTPDFATWRAERRRMDDAIRQWAAALQASDLAGDLTCYSGMNKTDMARPFALCVTHFFNHQTHHRGQVHAMVTSLGRKAPVSDLAFMPEES